MNKQQREAYIRAMSRVRPDNALNERVLLEMRKAEAARMTRGTQWIQIRGVASMAAVMLLVAGLVLGGRAVARMPVAWIDVDINPSVSLGLNIARHVVKAEGLNEEGREVLRLASQDSDMTDGDPEDAVEAVLRAASKLGYLKQNGENVVSLGVIPGMGNKEKDLSELAQKGAETALAADGVDAEVIAHVVGAERVKRAIELRRQDIYISPGKLNLVEKLLEMNEAAQGVDGTVKGLTDEQVRDLYGASVRDLQKQAKAYRKIIGPDTGDEQENDEENNGIGVPFGQEKKGEDKETPPGQEQRGDDKVTPPGQEKKGEDKATPPGLEQQGDDKMTPPGQENTEGDKGTAPGQENTDGVKTPPGQEKKADGDVPPGLEKKAGEGGTVPPGLVNKPDNSPGTKDEGNEEGGEPESGSRDTGVNAETVDVDRTDPGEAKKAADAANQGKGNGSGTASSGNGNGKTNGK